jgi:hypothetical protein
VADESQCVLLDVIRDGELDLREVLERFPDEVSQKVVYIKLSEFTLHHEQVPPATYRNLRISFESTSFSDHTISFHAIDHKGTFLKNTAVDFDVASKALIKNSDIIQRLTISEATVAQGFIALGRLDLIVENLKQIVSGFTPDQKQGLESETEIIDLRWVRTVGIPGSSSERREDTDSIHLKNIPLDLIMPPSRNGIDLETLAPRVSDEATETAPDRAAGESWPSLLLTRDDRYKTDDAPYLAVQTPDVVLAGMRGTVDIQDIHRSLNWPMSVLRPNAVALEAAIQGHLEYLNCDAENETFDFEYDFLSPQRYRVQPICFFRVSPYRRSLKSLNVGKHEFDVRSEVRISVSYVSEMSINPSHRPQATEQNATLSRLITVIDAASFLNTAFVGSGDPADLKLPNMEDEDFSNQIERNVLKLNNIRYPSEHKRTEIISRTGTEASTASQSQVTTVTALYSILLERGREFALCFDLAPIEFEIERMLRYGDIKIRLSVLDPSRSAAIPRQADFKISAKPSKESYAVVWPKVADMAFVARLGGELGSSDENPLCPLNEPFTQRKVSVNIPACRDVQTSDGHTTRPMSRGSLTEVELTCGVIPKAGWELPAKKELVKSLIIAYICDDARITSVTSSGAALNSSTPLDALRSRLVNSSHVLTFVRRDPASTVVAIDIGTRAIAVAVNGELIPFGHIDPFRDDPDLITSEFALPIDFHDVATSPGVHGAITNVLKDASYTPWFLDIYDRASNGSPYSPFRVVSALDNLIPKDELWSNSAPPTNASMQSGGPVLDAYDEPFVSANGRGGALHLPIIIERHNLHNGSSILPTKLLNILANSVDHGLILFPSVKSDACREDGRISVRGISLIQRKPEISEANLDHCPVIAYAAPYRPGDQTYLMADFILTMTICALLGKTRLQLAAMMPPPWSDAVSSRIDSLVGDPLGGTTSVVITHPASLGRQSLRRYENAVEASYKSAMEAFFPSMTQGSTRTYFDRLSEGMSVVQEYCRRRDSSSTNDAKTSAVLVFDVGAGTLDVTLAFGALPGREQRYEPYPRLSFAVPFGGDKFDEAIMFDIRRSLTDEHGGTQKYDALIRRLSGGQEERSDGRDAPDSQARYLSGVAYGSWNFALRSRITQAKKRFSRDGCREICELVIDCRVEAMDGPLSKPSVGPGRDGFWIVFGAKAELAWVPTLSVSEYFFVLRKYIVESTLREAAEIFSVDPKSKTLDVVVSGRTALFEPIYQIFKEEVDLRKNEFRDLKSEVQAVRLDEVASETRTLASMKTAVVQGATNWVKSNAWGRSPSTLFAEYSRSFAIVVGRWDVIRTEDGYELPCFVEVQNIYHLNTVSIAIPERQFAYLVLRPPGLNIKAMWNGYVNEQVRPDQGRSRHSSEMSPLTIRRHFDFMTLIRPVTWPDDPELVVQPEGQAEDVGADVPSAGPIRTKYFEAFLLNPNSGRRPADHSVPNPRPLVVADDRTLDAIFQFNGGRQELTIETFKGDTLTGRMVIRLDDVGAWVI